MIMRTFKQLGQAYGITPCTITASIDGNQVYSGTVPTVDEPIPSLPNSDLSIGQDLFTWQNPLEFAGTQTMTITVQGSPLMLTDTMANYLGAATANGKFLPVLLGTDPMSNVTIDGVAMDRAAEPVGQWYWYIPVNSTFEATVTITAGWTPPTP